MRNGVLSSAGGVVGGKVFGIGSLRESKRTKYAVTKLSGTVAA